MKNEIEKTFIIACEMYEKNIDRFQLKNTFAPIDKYSLSGLRRICALSRNRVLLLEAKESLLNHFKHSKYEIENTPVFFDYDELDRYLFDSRETKKVLYHLLRIAFLKLIYNSRFYIQVEDIKSINTLKTRNNISQFFRGQSVFSWRLTPSIFRGFKKNVVFDDDYYFNLLKSDGSEDKFNELLKYEDANKINRYDKYAFMQHSRSYSPFIDFTKDSVIATSFALSNVHNVNEFNNEESALFTFRPILGETIVVDDKWKAKDFIVKRLKIYVIDTDYFVLGQSYNLADSKGHITTIKIDLLEELVDKLTPKVALIDVPSNDRMIYQKGVLVCFYDCLCLNGVILYELSESFIKKEPILVANKRNLLNEIYHDRKYDYEHLMNPYLVFKE